MLTTADWAWEINFDTQYQIYENLAAIIETGMVDVQRQAYPWRNPENRRNSGFPTTPAFSSSGRPALLGSSLSV